LTPTADSEEENRCDRFRRPRIAGVAAVTLLDILTSVRRHWLVAGAVFILVVAAAAAVLVATPRTYVSTATIGIVPGGPSVGLENYGQLSNVAPLYAELAVSTAVRDRTRALVTGEEGVTSVRSFRDTPLVLKLDASASTPEAAQITASAFAEALLAEAANGVIAPRSQVTLRVFSAPGLPSTPVSPQRNLILLAGVLAGLVLAVVAAVFRDAPSRSTGRG